MGKCRRDLIFFVKYGKIKEKRERERFMNLLHLKYAVEVEKTKSIRKAAE